MNIKKEQLVEEIGLSIEERLNISPLAGRIYALLSLSSYDGLSFEDIRESMKASKSSISVNIKVLTQLGYITYHTKPGERKRYFKISKYFQIQSLELQLESLKKELEIVDKINNYNEKHHPEKFISENSLGLIAKKFLKENQLLIKNTLKEISDINQTD